MASTVHSLSIDATDPAASARFWAGVLGQPPVDGYAADARGVVSLAARAATGWPLRFLPRSYAKTGQARLHLDLASQSLEEQQATVARALDLGGSHVDIGESPDEEHVVLADPDGNEFCVIPAGNSFLAGCGLVGALSCDGSQAVGYFWSAALGWPLVWDQDEETAIQSPEGGSKISWGGPPHVPRPGERDRFHLDLAPVDADVTAEVERLVALGARRLADDGHGARLADPDGNDFYVVDPHHRASAASSPA